MADTTTDWSAGEQTGFNNTIASGGSGDTDVDLQTNGWDLVVPVIDVDLGSSSGITVEYYRSTDGGTTKATGQPLVGGKTINSNGVYPLATIMGEPYVTIRVINDDGSNATNTIKVTYRPRTWDTV